MPSHKSMDADDLAGREDQIEALYEAVCRRHDGIADFRAKLLALLPIASGAGIFLLAKDPISPVLLEHLSAIGIFGALVTVGLFFYELRGIQECNALIDAGKELEQALHSRLCEHAAFRSKPRSVFGVVGATGAALIIYPAVVAAWVYVMRVADANGKTDSAIATGRQAFLWVLLFGLLVVVKPKVGKMLGEWRTKRKKRRQKEA